MKVISERKIIEKEIDLNYPYYLYFQDEYCLNDELHKVGEEQTLIVKCGMHFNSIEIVDTKICEEYIIQNNLTTEEHFNEIFSFVNKSVSALL